MLVLGVFVQAPYTIMYLNSITPESSAIERLVVYGNVVAFASCACIIVGLIFGNFIVYFALQIILLMDLVSTFRSLDPQIRQVSILRCITEDLIVGISDTELVRFEQAYMRSWRRCGRIQARAQYIFLIVWGICIVNFVLQFYYSITLSCGTAPRYLREDIIHSSYWPLVLRTILPMIAEAVSLIPFVGSQLVRKVQTWAAQLTFTKPAMRHNFIAFINDLPLDAPIATFRADCRLLPYVLIFIVARWGLWAVELYFVFF